MSNIQRWTVSKWVFDNYQGTQVYFHEQVINDIKDYVQEIINKRPHSDNTVLEYILDIIKKAE